MHTGLGTLPRRYAVLLAVCLAVVIWFGLTIWQNNTTFDEWRSQLFDYPVPEGAVAVDSGSRFGHYEGNGKHCDGEAWLLLRGVDEEAALTHYEGVHGNLSVETEQPPDDSHAELVRVTIHEMYLTEHAYDPRCW